MKDNALITTMKESIQTSFSFKNAELNKFSASIAKLAVDNVKRNVELSKILGRILKTECYKEDGFKSVSDYAFQTFGIDKAMAYQLANVGNRFFNVDSETSNHVVELLNGKTSNLAEIAKLNDDELKVAIEDGKITKDSTQKELRELAKSFSAPKVVNDKFGNISCVVADFDNGKFTSDNYNNVVVTSPADILKACGFDSETDKIVKLYNLDKVKHVEGKEDKTVITGAVYSVYSIDGRTTARLEVNYIEKPKAKKESKSKGKGAASLLDDEEYKQFLAWKASKANNG